MPITILTKPKPGSYNKTQTPPKNPVGSPFIDRMTIGADITDEEHAAAVHSYIWSQVGDSEYFGSASPLGPYQRAWRLKLPSCNKAKFFPHLQYRYAGPLARRFSLSLAPKDIGPQGFDELRAILSSMVDGGWGFFLKNGNVSSLEVSVDISGFRVDAFHVLPVQLTATKSYANNGVLQTLYLGKQAGNQFRIYDRIAKRKAKGQKGYYGEGTRVERVLRNQKIPLVDFGQLANPFSPLKLIDLPSSPPPKLPANKQYVWTLFCDSVRLRGLQPALQLLPAESYRKLFRAWLGENKVPWWDPDEVWTGWKPMLKELTFFSE